MHEQASDQGNDHTPAANIGLVTKKVVARAASASLRTIDNWQREKKIPFIKISPRCVRFDLEAVLKALKKFEVKQVS
jgi:hypothetical protein